MTPPRELIALLTRLRQRGQPLKQVRLLLKFWQAVDDVPERERGRLMRQLGLEGSEELIQTVLRRGGRLDPGLAASAIGLLDTISPARLKSFAAKYLSPEETDQLLSMVRHTLADQAGDLAPGRQGPNSHEEEEAPAAPPSSEPDVRRGQSGPVDVEREIEEVIDAAAEVVESAVEAGAAAGIGGLAAAAAARQRTKSRPKPKRKPTTRSVEKAQPEPEPEPEAEPQPPETEPEPAPEPEAKPEPKPEARPKPVPTPPKPRPLPPAEPPSPAWVETVAAQTSPTARFRVFRRVQDSIDSVNRAQLRELVELFPPGWMRRRVLTAVFAKGLLPVDEATGLLAELQPTPVTYLWLAGALLDDPGIGEAQRQLLIDQAPSATIKRLLQIRRRV